MLGKHNQLTANKFELMLERSGMTVRNRARGPFLRFWLDFSSGMVEISKRTMISKKSKNEHQHLFSKNHEFEII